MTKLPFVKGFYNATRQLVNAIMIDHSAFSKVVVIKYPWENTYTLAFLTALIGPEINPVLKAVY